MTAALLAYYTSAQVDALLWRLPHRGSAGRGDDQRHHRRTACLLHLGAGRRTVGRLPHRGRAAGLPDGPGPGRVHNQPNHLGAGGVPFSRRPGHGNGLKHRSRAAQLLHHRTSLPASSESPSALQIAVRFPDDGGADEVVAAIGEHILSPTNFSLSNWTVRPSSGCSVVGRLHPDPGGEPVEHRAHLQLDPGPRAPLRLPARSARPPTSWCTCPRQTTSTTPCTAASRPGRLEHGQDVLHSASERSCKQAKCFPLSMPNKHGPQNSFPI